MNNNNQETSSLLGAHQSRQSYTGEETGNGSHNNSINGEDAISRPSSAPPTRPKTPCVEEGKPVPAYYPSPGIHFDDRLGDETSTYESPLLYFASSGQTLFNPSDRHIPRMLSELSIVEVEQGESELDESAHEDRIEEDKDARIGCWWLCNQCNPLKGHPKHLSPKRIRFCILVLVSLLPFGSHFVKNSFSSLQVFFLSDPKIHFTGTMYGTLVSCQSLPNVVMPVLGGLILDSRGHRLGLIVFLLIALLGHVAFTLAMTRGVFGLALVGEIIYGLGSGTVIVGQRAVVSKFFYDSELTFALGVTVAVACTAKTVAKATVAPVAEAYGSYAAALWFGACWQVMSLLAGVVYVKVLDQLEHHGKVSCDRVGHLALSASAFLITLQRSTFAFWFVVILHTLYTCIYHLFANFSGHYLVEEYGLTAVHAGYLSSLMPLCAVFGAPLGGFVMDRFGGQLWVLLACASFTVWAYILLMQSWNPVIGVAMLALCQSFVPTILISMIPLTVDHSVYGAAFGIGEVMQSLGLLLGNVFMGYSRDATSSYATGIASVTMLAAFCILLVLALICWDYCHGQVLNCPRSRFGYRSMPA